jgi:hypothetical protein
VELVEQLIAERIIPGGPSDLYLDEGIKLPASQSGRLAKFGIEAHPGASSIDVGGIQVADHAAHALGGMLLEEIGVLKKFVRAGENSGYDPDEMLELGFELWASLRYALAGRNEHIPGMSPPPEDPANPFFRVDGVGLYVAPTCPPELASHARNRFGINYLGCIH